MTDDTETAARALVADLAPAPISAAPGQNMLPPNARRDVGETPLWRGHDGPATLFVHGWNDTHRIWRQFAQDFLANSRPVLLMDLPAHGASKSTTYDAAHAGQSVFDVCKAEAPIDAIIAHSFGCVATATALKNGAKADYVILIAPPIFDWAETRRRSGVDPAVVARALDLMREAGKHPPAPFDFEGALSGYDGKLLFIGSDADEICPLDDIERVGARLPSAQVRGVTELGHRELCLDPGVLEVILSFLGYA